MAVILLPIENMSSLYNKRKKYRNCSVMCQNLDSYVYKQSLQLNYGLWSRFFVCLS